MRVPMFAALCVAAVLTGSCSSPKRPTDPAPVRGAGAGPAPALWGDMKPVVSVKELMRDFIDPASDYVFDSVGIVTTHNKVVETAPKSDADWDKIRTESKT